MPFCLLFAKINGLDACYCSFSFWWLHQGDLAIVLYWTLSLSYPLSVVLSDDCLQSRRVFESFRQLTTWNNTEFWLLEEMVEAPAIIFILFLFLPFSCLCILFRFHFPSEEQHNCKWNRTRSKPEKVAGLWSHLSMLMTRWVARCFPKGRSFLWILWQLNFKKQTYPCRLL